MNNVDVGFDYEAALVRLREKYKNGPPRHPWLRRGTENQFYFIFAAIKVVVFFSMMGLGLWLPSSESTKLAVIKIIIVAGFAAMITTMAVMFDWRYIWRRVRIPLLVVAILVLVGWLLFG